MLMSSRECMSHHEIKIHVHNLNDLSFGQLVKQKDATGQWWASVNDLVLPKRFPKSLLPPCLRKFDGTHARPWQPLSHAFLTTKNNSGALTFSISNSSSNRSITIPSPPLQVLTTQQSKNIGLESTSEDIWRCCWKLIFKHVGTWEFQKSKMCVRGYPNTCQWKNDTI